MPLKFLARKSPPQEFQKVGKYEIDEWSLACTICAILFDNSMYPPPHQLCSFCDKHLFP